MRRLPIAFLILVLPSQALPAAELSDPPAYRFPLTSASKNRRSGPFFLTHRDLPRTGSARWSIRKRSLRGGKQDGVELIILDNGKLVLTIIPTRGLSVLEVRHGDLRLGWDSPVKEIVHPQFVNLERRGGLGWLEGFNEWMVRCGLEYAGHPGKDEFIDNTGKKAEMDLTLHGRIGNLPASEVEVLVDRKPPHRLRVRGVVHERSFYGPKLQLTAEVSTEPGSDSFRIEDAVTNHGADAQEFQLIYHTNYGSPLLEKGATVQTAAKKITPMNAHAAKAIDAPFTYEGPTKGFIEQVYLIEPLADDQGRATVLLKNAAGDRGSSITWATAQLPYLTIWKNTAAKEDGYVTGLEPATGFPFNRKVERQFGRVPKLAPRQTRRFTLDFGLYEGKEAVSAASQKITALQNKQKPVIDKEPPKLPK